MKIFLFDKLAIDVIELASLNISASYSIKMNENITYVTHATIPSRDSAVTTFTPLQLGYISLIVLSMILGILCNPLAEIQIVIAFLSTVYFVDVLFNLYLVLYSIKTSGEITASLDELEALHDDILPIYSILCPLYKESHVLPQFLDGISHLSWPKEKLEVILLLEEDDTESLTIISNMGLPQYVKTVVVPHSFPKTKPKACNYGLSYAGGEYIVIYDAEDIPDPLQLKKAYLAFTTVDKKVVCLQAKLNYYNTNQNLLTRFFTAEYSLWFDIILPGLQSLKTVVPLGGTSNHFRASILRELQGWDPFNVTEDADLGMRIFKKGYLTAILDSVTREEANSNIKNWLRQRSRWIKGYMQTYLVHTRQIFPSFVFYLLFGGRIAFIFINPLLWLVTLAYFTLHNTVGTYIESLYSMPVLYIAILSFIVGNYIYLFSYILGCAKKEQWSVIKYVFLMPLYWLLISIAGNIALYQLIFKPHYWEKTIHGLHLKRKKQFFSIKIPFIFSLPKIDKNPLYAE